MMRKKEEEAEKMENFSKNIINRASRSGIPSREESKSYIAIFVSDISTLMLSFH
jgi:hypothetical protein